MKAPAFQFYAADHLASQDVALLTLEEEGAFLRAYLSCWLHGSIPSDPEKLARLIGKGASTTLATTVATMFQADGDKLIHPVLEAERVKQAEWRAKSAAGGKKSAEKRAEASKSKVASTTLKPPLKGSLLNGSNQKATLQSSSSSLPLGGGEEEKCSAKQTSDAFAGLMAKTKGQRPPARSAHVSTRTVEGSVGS